MYVSDTKSYASAMELGVLGVLCHLLLNLLTDSIHLDVFSVESVCLSVDEG